MHIKADELDRHATRRERVVESSQVEMLVHSATCGVLAVSGITILACMFAVAVIYGQVQSIWLELDIEMDQFKLEADDLWRDMLKMGAGLASNRQRRQSVYGGYGAVGTNKEPPPPITKTLVSNPLHVSAPACSECLLYVHFY